MKALTAEEFSRAFHFEADDAVRMKMLEGRVAYFNERSQDRRRRLMALLIFLAFFVVLPLAFEFSRGRLRLSTVPNRDGGIDAIVLSLSGTVPAN